MSEIKEQQNQESMEDKKEKMYRYRCSLTYFLTFFLNGCIINYLGPSIPQLKDVFHKEETDFKVVFLTRGIGYMIGSLTASKIMHHWAFAIGLFVCGGASAVLSIITNFPLFCSIFFVLGLGGGVVEVQSQVFLIWVHGQNVSPWMQALHFLFGGGALLSPIIVAQLHYDYSYFLFGILDILIILTLFKLDTPKNPNSNQDRKAEAYSSINVVDQNDNDIKKKLIEKKKKDVPLTLSILIAFLLFLYVGSEVSFGGWIATFLHDQFDINKYDAAYGSTIFWGAIAIGRLIAIPVSKTANKNIYQLINYLGCIGSCLYMIISNLSKTSVYVGAIIFGLFMASIYPFAICFPTYMNMNTTAQFTSICTVFAIAGEFLIPYFMGMIMSKFDSTYFIYSCFILTIIQILLFAYIYFYTKIIQIQKKKKNQTRDTEDDQNILNNQENKQIDN